MWLTESLRLGINIFLFFCDVSRRQRRSFQLFTEFMISDCLRIYLFQISFENPTFFSSSALFGSSAVAATTVVVGCYFLLFFAYSFLHCNLRFFLLLVIILFLLLFNLSAPNKQKKLYIFKLVILFRFVRWAHTTRSVHGMLWVIFLIYWSMQKKSSNRPMCLYTQPIDICEKVYTIGENAYMCFVSVSLGSLSLTLCDSNICCCCC